MLFPYGLLAYWFTDMSAISATKRIMECTVKLDPAVDEQSFLL
jgi:hypothetical protein